MNNLSLKLHNLLCRCSFRCTSAPKGTPTGALVYSLFIISFLCVPAYAETNWEDLLEFNQSPEGQVENPPVTLKSHDVGENTEQHLPPAAVFNLWIQDETFFKPSEEDRVEIQNVLEKDAKTFKLENAVAPIPFKSGQEIIPEKFVTELKQLLDRMKNRDNVRVHFVGHSDDDADILNEL